MSLTPLHQRFILHWGEMGDRWGINRTVAQIHALLYLAPKPLPAETIAETLQVARSNVSNSLRELQGWGIVRRVHVLGDKRDHFESLQDVWTMFRMVLAERKRREVDPSLAMLEDCLADAARRKDTDPHTIERLKALHGFFQTTTGWYLQLEKLPTKALIRLMNAGDRVLRMFGGD